MIFKAIIRFKQVGYGIYDGFGSGLGGLAISLVGHMSFIWLFALAFYIAVLWRIQERLQELVDDLRGVGFWTIWMVLLKKSEWENRKFLSQNVTLISGCDSDRKRRWRSDGFVERPNALLQKTCPVNFINSNS